MHRSDFCKPVRDGASKPLLHQVAQNLEVIVMVLEAILLHDDYGYTLKGLWNGD